MSSSPAATSPPSETAPSLNGHVPQEAAHQQFPEPRSMRLRCGRATDSFNAEDYRQDANTVCWLQVGSGQETEAGYTGKEGQLGADNRAPLPTILYVGSDVTDADGFPSEIETK